MFCVTYSKTRPASTSPPLSNRTWFGTNHHFVGSEAPLYQENSFYKHDYNLSKDQRRLKVIQKEFDKAKVNVEQLRSQIHYSYIMKKQLATVYKRKLMKKEVKEQAAIRIQKLVRGYLVRKKLLDVIIN